MRFATADKLFNGVYDFFFPTGLPTIFHLFAHSVPVEERSRAFSYLLASGSVGQTVASVVSISYR